MSGQNLATNSLAGIADILPPSVPVPEIGTASSLWFVALAVAIVIIAGLLLRWRTSAHYRLFRLAHACESGLLDSRDVAHRLAAELGRYCTDSRLSESSPPQGVAIDIDIWSNFLSVLASQRFGPQEPEAHAVAHSIHQAERWLRGARRVG